MCAFQRSTVSILNQNKHVNKYETRKKQTNLHQLLTILLTPRPFQLVVYAVWHGESAFVKSFDKPNTFTDPCFQIVRNHSNHILLVPITIRRPNIFLSEVGHSGLFENTFAIITGRHEVRFRRNLYGTFPTSLPELSKLTRTPPPPKKINNDNEK